MIARVTGAALRAVLVALLIALPSLMLPTFVTGASEMAVLIALLAGTLTFIEYNAAYPSFVEFRDAAPVNRLRFASLFIMALMLSLICKDVFAPTGLTRMSVYVANNFAEVMDFPYSPVRLMTLILPAGSTQATYEAMRMAAALTYVLSLLTVLAFVVLVRVTGWPIHNGSFNVWTNLPLFDPTGGGDVVTRLKRDGRINLIFGVLLPFIVPAVIKMASDLIAPVSIHFPQNLIWMVAAWAFLPASMVMRGVSMIRIADLIEDKRKRRFDAESEMLQTA